MHITLMMVSTVNGKITRGDDPFITDWSSPEDMILFRDIKSKHNLIVMGHKTYQANKDRIQLSDKTLHIVLTKNPTEQKKNEVTGQIEFTDVDPKTLIINLQSRGYSDMLLVGGSEINALFFKNSLVDELHLTIEPYLFGSGLNMIAENAFAVELQLRSVEKLNDRGTLYAKYSVNKV